VVGELTVCVAAVWGGWSVQCDAIDHPLMFLSGAKAEAKAHDLGRRLAVLGRTTRVTIHDRNHVPLVTAVYFADDALEAAPLIKVVQTAHKGAPPRAAAERAGLDADG
jgi:hypothetical protein